MKRHIVASWRDHNPHAGVMNLLRFVYSVARAYYLKRAIQPQAPDDDFAITRVATKQILSDCSQKVIHCRRQADIEQFQERIRN
jgi:hypothetical protein